jgi:hypothetical protein
MTRRSTDNRQKKIVAPRGARGGARRIRVTPTRPAAPPAGDKPSVHPPPRERK